MRVLSSTTRPLCGTGRPNLGHWPHSPAGRPTGGGALVMIPLPVAGPGGLSYNGMDPSDPASYVRPWNPQPGMIGYLNFDGAAAQGDSDTGGVSSAPANRVARAGARPKRRPR